MHASTFGHSAFGRRIVLSIVLIALAGPCPASAAPARCYTTDDGEYDCDFKSTDEAGSFEISAPGKPTFSLIIEAPGTASGYANFGDRNVPLPGTFMRSKEDTACWENAETETEICAW